MVNLGVRVEFLRGLLLLLVFLTYLNLLELTVTFSSSSIFSTSSLLLFIVDSLLMSMVGLLFGSIVFFLLRILPPSVAGLTLLVVSIEPPSTVRKSFVVFT